MKLTGRDRRTPRAHAHPFTLSCSCSCSWVVPGVHTHTHTHRDARARARGKKHACATYFFGTVVRLARWFIRRERFKSAHTHMHMHMHMCMHMSHVTCTCHVHAHVHVSSGHVEVLPLTLGMRSHLALIPLFELFGRKHRRSGAFNRGVPLGPYPCDTQRRQCQACRGQRCDMGRARGGRGAQST